MDKQPSAVVPLDLDPAVAKAALAREPRQPSADAKTDAQHGLKALKEQLRPDRRERPVFSVRLGDHLEAAAGSEPSTSYVGSTAWPSPRVPAGKHRQRKRQKLTEEACCLPPLREVGREVWQAGRNDNEGCAKRKRSSVKEKQQALAKAVPAAQLRACQL